MNPQAHRTQRPTTYLQHPFILGPSEGYSLFVENLTPSPVIEDHSGQLGWRVFFERAQMTQFWGYTPPIHVDPAVVVEPNHPVPVVFTAGVWLSFGIVREEPVPSQICPRIVLKARDLAMLYADRGAAAMLKEVKAVLLTESEKQRIGEVRRLSRDWDGCDSEPISQGATGAAVEVLRDVARQHHIRPRFINPLSGDGVQLEWRTPRGEAEAEIYADGTINYLIIEGAGNGRVATTQAEASRDQLLAAIAKIAAD